MTATLIHRSKSNSGALWQGSVEDAAEAGGSGRFNVIILCAMEWQPAKEIFALPNVEVLYAPNDDGPPLTRPQVERATKAARLAAKAYRAGKRVLITCMEGRNRSGLVMAITLHLICGISGRQAQGLIRSRRPTALTNRSFQLFLSKIPSKLDTQTAGS